MKTSQVLAATLAALAVVAAFATAKSAWSQEGGQVPETTKKVTELNQKSPERADKVIKSEDEWRAQLSPEQYAILRGHGTERAFCGVNLEDKGDGAYHCVGCDLPLFKAGRKFNSGTGWPSYTEPAAENSVWYVRDVAFGMVRTEVRCARCDGHLGHVFDDGPPPSGMRFCINGTVLKFVAKKLD